MIKQYYKEKNRISYKKELIKLETESELKNKLQKIYSLNEENLQKKNDNLINILGNPDLLYTAFEKIKRNKGSMTVETLEETVDSLTKERIEQISKEIKLGKFQWTDIRRQMISKSGKKKKRPLGIPNFNDRIVQEGIRIILNIIYEPIFQRSEMNHGFRPNRGTQTAILKLQRESKEMYFALEGDIKGAYDHVQHPIMIEILKKKITDKKFLKLIETGLKQNIIFEGKRQENLVGTPQRGIASPILFNIYMHEFDLFVERKLTKWAIEKNEAEKRTDSGELTSETRRVKSRIEKLTTKIKNIKRRKKKEMNNVEVIRRLTKEIRNNKKRLLQIEPSRLSSRTIRYSYIRYADDFIIMTNAKREELGDIKDWITEWLENELRLILDQEKTLITDLNKSKARFLGFTIFRKKKRIIRKTNKTGKVFRQRSTVELTIGIDHERVKDRLIAGKILNLKNEPRSNLIYVTMGPYQIVTKYRQRIEGLYNYYYTILTYPEELNFYYYAYKFSCLKTLGRRMKMSIKQIFMKYGEKILIKTTQTETNSEGKEKTRELTTHYPTYKEIVRKNKEMKKKTLKVVYYRIGKSQNNNMFEKLDIGSMISQDWKQFDPFSMNEIAVNLRSAYQLKTHCSVCGKEQSSETELELHHVKHVRKGDATGFTKIMRDLNRKMIPVCKACHKKIHKGRYDGKTLREIYDIELILS